MIRLLSLIAGIISILTSLPAAQAQGQEVVMQPSASDILFSTGWFGEMRRALDLASKPEDEAPLMVIHKRATATIDDNRTLIVVPFLKEAGDDFSQLKRMKVIIVRSYPKSEIFSKVIEAGETKELLDLWSKTTDLAVHSSYLSSVDAGGALVDPNEYRGFVAMKGAKDLPVLGMHFMFMIYMSKEGTKGKEVEDGIERILRSVEAAK